MATKNYHVKLEGNAQLHQPVIKLEDINVNIWSLDGGVTWENKNVTLDVNGSLEIFMSCKAMSGTDWKFSVKNKTTGTKIYETDGNYGRRDSQLFRKKQIRN